MIPPPRDAHDSLQRRVNDRILGAVARLPREDGDDPAAGCASGSRGSARLGLADAWTAGTVREGAMGSGTARSGAFDGVRGAIGRPGCLTSW